MRYRGNFVVFFPGHISYLKLQVPNVSSTGRRDLKTIRGDIRLETLWASIEPLLTHLFISMIDMTQRNYTDCCQTLFLCFTFVASKQETDESFNLCIAEKKFWSCFSSVPLVNTFYYLRTSDWINQRGVVSTPCWIWSCMIQKKVQKTLVQVNCYRMQIPSLIRC